MAERFMSGLVIVMGLMSAGIGVATARRRFRAAGRVYRKTAALYAATPEGWASWFLGGFSSLTVGTHWLLAAAALTIWTMAGIVLVGLGLQLFWRA